MVKESQSRWADETESNESASPILMIYASLLSVLVDVIV
jgi:hypothetical protein